MIQELEEHVKKTVNGTHDRLRAGQPYRISEAASVGDRGWQGDLRIEIVDKIPSDYVRVENPKPVDCQLVPGNNIGSRHCLDSLEGVELYRPKVWNDEVLTGPAFVLHQERTICHPTHGDVTIPAGFTVVTGYQREYDKEQQRERRARD